MPGVVGKYVVREQKKEEAIFMSLPDLIATAILGDFGGKHFVLMALMLICYECCHVLSVL